MFFTGRVVKQGNRNCKFSILGDFEDPALSCSAQKSLLIQAGL